MRASRGRFEVADRRFEFVDFDNQISGRLLVLTQIGLCQREAFLEPLDFFQERTRGGFLPRLDRRIDSCIQAGDLGLERPDLCPQLIFMLKGSGHALTQFCNLPIEVRFAFKVRQMGGQLVDLCRNQCIEFLE